MLKVNKRLQVDIKGNVTECSMDVDLLVCYADRDGLWFSTKSRHEANKKIFFTNRVSDLKINYNQRRAEVVGSSVQKFEY